MATSRFLGFALNTWQFGVQGMMDVYEHQRHLIQGTPLEHYTTYVILKSLQMQSANLWRCNKNIMTTYHMRPAVTSNVPSERYSRRGRRKANSPKNSTIPLNKEITKIHLVT